MCGLCPVENCEIAFVWKNPFTECTVNKKIILFGMTFTLTFTSNFY